MPGGVAMLDYDGDGFEDLFFVNGARLESPMRPGASPNKSDPNYWNRLYHNNGDGTFTDVTGKAGLRGYWRSEWGLQWETMTTTAGASLYVTN